jgi:HEAT repeat protein
LSLRALGRIGGSDPEFVKVMLEAARHPALYSACYGSAYETNFRPAIRAAFPLLQASLEKTNDLQSPVRTFAATAVGQLIPEVREAAPLLARTLDTNLSGLMRAACAMPISKADADYRLIVPALVRDLGRGGDFVVRRTLFELSARTPLVVDELTAALQRPEPAWQANIATALAEYGDKAAGSLPRLRALASTQDSTLGYAVGLALWRVGKEPDVWVPYLVEVLKSPDNQKKWTALQQLAEIGEPASRAVPQVTEMLSSDPNNRLRGQAAITLGEIGPKAGAGLPALSAAQADEYLNVREAASKAIPKVRGR